MQRYWAEVKFDFVTMDGDNIYGGHSPSDFHLKFEEPYKALLDEGVKFYASSAITTTHRSRSITSPTTWAAITTTRFSKKNVEFFVLDSNYMTPQQLSWLEDKLKGSTAKWKIAYFHHPLYHLRQVPRTRRRSAQPADAALHEIRRQRGVERPRACL